MTATSIAVAINEKGVLWGQLVSRPSSIVKRNSNELVWSFLYLQSKINYLDPAFDDVGFTVLLWEQVICLPSGSPTSNLAASTLLRFLNFNGLDVIFSLDNSMSDESNRSARSLTDYFKFKSSLWTQPKCINQLYSKFYSASKPPLTKGFHNPSKHLSYKQVPFDLWVRRKINTEKSKLCKIVFGEPI